MLRPHSPLPRTSVAISIALATVAALAAAATPAGALPDLLPTTAPCPAPSFIPNSHLVATSPDEYAKVSFHVEETTSGYFWAEAAFHWATSSGAPTHFGFAAERAMPIGYIESASGERVGGPLSFSLHPYGVQVVAPELELRVSANDDPECGGAAGGDFLTLAPGDYVFIIFGASETASEVAAVLPKAVTITGVEYGPAYRISEAEMDCAAKSHVTGVGLASIALVDCALPVATENRGYFGLSVSRFPDAAHQVMWRSPDGTTSLPIVFGSYGVRDPGAWTLLVPRYVSPVSHPLYVPVNAPYIHTLGGDSGIFGAFADVA